MMEEKFGPKWLKTKMEDDQNGRRPKWKTTKMEDYQNGIQPKWKQRRIKLGCFQRVCVLHIFALRDFSQNVHLVTMVSSTRTGVLYPRFARFFLIFLENVENQTVIAVGKI